MAANKEKLHPDRTQVLLVNDTGARAVGLSQVVVLPEIGSCYWILIQLFKPHFFCFLPKDWLMNIILDYWTLYTFVMPGLAFMIVVILMLLFLGLWSCYIWAGKKISNSDVCVLKLVLKCYKFIIFPPPFLQILLQAFFPRRPSENYQSKGPVHVWWKWEWVPWLYK